MEIPGVAKPHLKSLLENLFLALGRPEIAHALLKSRQMELNETYNLITLQLAKLSPDGKLKALDALSSLKSQIGQDFWAISMLGLDYCVHSESSPTSVSGYKKRGGVFR